MIFLIGTKLRVYYINHPIFHLDHIVMGIPDLFDAMQTVVVQLLTMAQLGLFEMGSPLD